MSIFDLDKVILDKMPIKAEQKQLLQRRINKLKRDPKGFVEASYAKRKDQARKYLPIKHDGKFSYTIVSAVYNVEKYLDEYFDSIINQSLNFKKHIHIILVDDGSTDNSAAIIKKWQKKYPSNIHYYYKENGGQASARNLGLQYVKTDWVTFIDPDDFLDVDFFKNTDEILDKNRSVKILAANTIFYMEAKNAFKDSHPLRFRFHQKDKKFAIKSLDNKINLSAAASIFDAKIIQDNQLAFDSIVKPNFEDGKFIGEFLIHAYAHDAWFADNVIYNYRKRDDGSSTLDGAWLKPEKYANVLEYGFLELINKYKVRFGSVPKNIQFTAMYDMYWYLTQLINQPEKINFLSEEQKQHYYRLYDEIMDAIDSQTIMNFGMAGAWFFHKVGFLGAFKGEKPPFQICYIESIDRAKQQVLISHFDYFDSPVSYQLNGQDVVPQQQKQVANTFNDKLFVYEKRAWIGYESSDEVLSIQIDGKPARLALSNLAHKPQFKIADIEQAFSSPKYQNDGSWLLMDRETKADDNAEHLYRYIQTHHPEQKCYFALNRDSVDWDRLADDGFNLVAFGESDFELRLAASSKIISSHIEAHIHNYFGDLYAGTKQFVFLQHGVTQNNLSRWLNGKRHIASFITTTKDEYRSIAMNEKYKFGKKETVLTGFPRHDELYRKNQASEPSKTILIMPTWRSYLMGETVGKGSNTRELNMNLLKSDYAEHWVSLLCSDGLRQLAEEYGYRVIFAPHANIEPYLPHMNLPTYLQIWSASKTDESMQDLFVRASMMITDYSSVAFEMAYIGKPTLYYQFDKDEFFSGKHSLQKGYFEYEQHGFGAVSYDEQTLLNDLADLLKNGVAEEYQYRIDNTFAYQDDQNSERVYQAIKALDEPSDNLVDTVLLTQMLDNAYKHQAWDLVVSRAKLLLEHEPDNEQAQSLLVQGLTHAKQWQQAGDVLEQYQLDETIEGAGELAFLTAFANKDWQGAVDAYQHITPNFDLDYKQLQALEKLGERKQTVKFINKLQQQALSEAQQTALSLRLLDLDAAYEPMLDLSEKVALMQTDELAELKPQLLLAKAHRMLGAYDDAHAQLVAFEKHTRDDVDCRLEIANLAYDRGNYAKSVAQFEILLKADYTLDESDYARYLQAVYLAQDFAKYEQLFAESDVTLHDDEAKIAYIKSLANQQKWQETLTAADELSVSAQPELAYELTLARYRLGGVEEVYRPDIRLSTQDSYEYWQLISEIAFLMDDRELEKYCYRGMISIYPNKDKQANMEKLAALR